MYKANVFYHDDDRALWSSAFKRVVRVLALQYWSKRFSDPERVKQSSGVFSDNKILKQELDTSFHEIATSWHRWFKENQMQLKH